MKILWLTNFILPDMAEALGLPGTNKEGWVVGMSRALKAHSKENGIELAIVAPVSSKFEQGAIGIYDGVKLYGFHEFQSPEFYDSGAERILFAIAEDFKPDVIHIFGTEYPHTRAMVEGIRKYGNDENGLTVDRILIGIQGVMMECAEHYLDGIPGKVRKTKTFRDIVRRDTMFGQYEKFKMRAVNELAALQYVGHVTGRTPFDENFCKNNAFMAKYHFMNETLRSDFYEGGYDESKANPHEIFVCQGDYPLKGLHFVIQALPKIIEKYPDTKVYVAGDSITREAKNMSFVAGLKERLKLPAYGKYLRKLMRDVSLQTGKECPIEFVGRISSDEIKKRYLSAGLYIIPSTVENSSNSLGEAMLLGLPCIAANVGGLPGIMKNEEEGLLYEAGNPDALFASVDRIWSDEALRHRLMKNARERALADHNPEMNYNRLIEIYTEIDSERN